METSASPPVPSSAGWRGFLGRLGFRAVLVLPKWMRQPFGFWRWNEILDDKSEGYWALLYDERARVARNDESTPVERLLRYRVMPPSHRVPWPHRFSNLAAYANWDNFWSRVSPRELDAWVTVWNTHPKGQQAREKALAGLAGAGLDEPVRRLVEAGTSPNAWSAHGSAMYHVWGSPHLGKDNLPKVWAALNAGEHPPSWEAWRSKTPWVRFRGPEVLKGLEGLPLPQGEDAMAFVLDLVRDVSLGNDAAMAQEIQALAWWRQNGALDQVPDAQARLIATWVTSVRPGAGEDYQRAMEAWFDALTQGAALPPLHRHGQVPGDTWSHVLLRRRPARHFPPRVRDAFLQVPNAWTAVNGQGKTAQQVLLEMGRKEGLLKEEEFQALHRLTKAGGLSESLDQRLGEASATPDVRPRPRL